MYKVLVADDERVGRQGIAFLLKQLPTQFEIVEANNGKVALEILKSDQDIDILLTDIKMPIMDGISLISQAVNVNANLEIVIFSGYSDFSYAKDAIKYGVKNYILKPVNPDEFNQTITGIISQIESRKQSLLVTKQNETIYQEHLLYCLVNNIPTKEDFDKLNFDYNGLILLTSDSNVFSENDFDAYLACANSPGIKK